MVCWYCGIKEKPQQVTLERNLNGAGTQVQASIVHRILLWIEGYGQHSAGLRRQRAGCDTLDPEGEPLARSRVGLERKPSWSQNEAWAVVMTLCFGHGSLSGQLWVEDVTSGVLSPGTSWMPVIAFGLHWLSKHNTSLHLSHYTIQIPLKSCLLWFLLHTAVVTYHNP